MSPVSPTAAPSRAGRRRGQHQPGRPLWDPAQRLCSFRPAWASKELILCGCGGEVKTSFTCQLEDSFQQPPNIYFLSFDLASAGESHCIFFAYPLQNFPYRISLWYNTCDFRIPCFFLSYPVPRLSFVCSHTRWAYGLMLVGCLSCSVFCSVHLGHDKNLWLIRALYMEGPYHFSPPSPPRNSSYSRQKKLMQLSQPEQ